MVVGYLVVCMVEVLLAIIGVLFLFIKRKEIYGIAIRIICSTTIIAVEIVKMLSKIASTKSCFWVCIWLFILAITLSQLKKNIHTIKNGL